jgi:uncharacterized glyoxalase superfamily protein PhnB
MEFRSRAWHTPSTVESAVMAEKVPVLVPVLAVDDIEKAMEFYGLLGFDEVFSIPDDDGRLVHAHLRKGDSVMFLGRLDVSYYEGRPRAAAIERSRMNGRGLGVALIVQVDNLEEIYDLACERGLEILSEPADEYYGDRVFLLVDPFGYEWKISQPI